MFRWTYDLVGPFDEQFEFEQDDLDYSIRAHDKSLRMGVCSAFVHHVGHQSMDDKSPDKRFLSLYRILEKYKDRDVCSVLGTKWPNSWLNEVALRYPEVKNFASYISSK